MLRLLSIISLFFLHACSPALIPIEADLAEDVVEIVEEEVKEHEIHKEHELLKEHELPKQDAGVHSVGDVQMEKLKFQNEV